MCMQTRMRYICNPSMVSYFRIAMSVCHVCVSTKSRAQDWAYEYINKVGMTDIS